MLTFIERHKDSISSAAAICSIIVAIVGFGLTIWQINKATRQLQSSNEYNIRKDLRELVQKVRTEYISTTCLKNGATCSIEDKRKNDFGIGLIFNLHHSIYLQSEAHGISKKFRFQMAKDFCSWFKLPAANELWNAQVEQGNYDSDRVRMKKEWCQ